MTKFITIAAAAFLLLAGPAAARHDSGSELESMQRTAYELEKAAQSLHQRIATKTRRADRRADRRVDRRADRRVDRRADRRVDRREEGALGALHRLADRAAKFNDRIDRYENRPAKLRREYDRLHVAFEQAEHCFRELRVGKRAHRELAHVSRLVYRLGDRVESVLIARRDRRRGSYDVAFQAPWPWWWSARLGY